MPAGIAIGNNLNLKIVSNIKGIIFGQNNIDYKGIIFGQNNIDYKGIIFGQNNIEYQRYNIRSK